MPNCRAQRGLTLIELLVAVSLLAIVSVLGYRGLETVRLSTDHATRQGESMQRLAMVFARIERDLANAIPPPVDAPTLFQGNAQELVFLRLAAGGTTLRRLGYRWQADSSELLLLGWPTIDGDAGPLQVLIDGVASLAFSYLDSDGRWLLDWPVASAALPRAIKIELNGIERVFDVPAAE